MLRGPALSRTRDVLWKYLSAWPCGSLSVTGSTHSFAVFADSRVVVCVFVALFAVGLAPVVVVLPLRVFAGRDYFKVLWVDAVAYPAEVVELHSFGDWLVVGVFPHDSVDDSWGVAGAALCEGVAVAVEASLPFPAAGFVVDFDEPHEACLFCSVELVSHGVDHTHIDISPTIVYYVTNQSKEAPRTPNG